MRLINLLFLTTLPFFCLSTESSEKTTEKLNVVFILADDLGWRDLSCQGSNYYYHIALGNVRPCSAIQSGNWKLIEYLEDDRLELYNLTTDPYELWNVAEENPEVAEKLQMKLKNWRKETGAQLPERKKEE